MSRNQQGLWEASAVLYKEHIEVSNSSFIFQTSQVYDVNANAVDNDKELFHPSKLTLTEALALESGGMLIGRSQEWCSFLIRP